jgi:dipeptidyl aminopeptidase/acylaminoacyl peptidase
MVDFRARPVELRLPVGTLVLICWPTGLLTAADSPNDRRPTDPKSLGSPSSSSARAVPIEDFVYGRRVSSQAWSPDGKRIVFTTNLTGRANLWVVNSEGGWALQLTVSDDRQSGAVWSPDGKWIVYQQNFGGGEYYDLFRVSSSGGSQPYR